MQQIPVPQTLDIEVVEKALAELWEGTAGQAHGDSAVLRARVANLLVYVPHEATLAEVNELMEDVTIAHPSRALVMLGELDASDRDIEMFVSSVCQTDKRTGAKRLCGEVVVLKARGKFVVELPSASLPLVISDLTTFLWWRDQLKLSDKVFNGLLRASDRLVIDSDEFANPLPEMVETNSLFGEAHFRHVGVSDLNWSRLTLWRGLLADFYDVPAYQTLLDNVEHMRIDYVSPAGEAETTAPQALLFAGWLANCLGWSIADNQTEQTGASQSFVFSASSGESEASKERQIKVELKRVEAGDIRRGRLVEVELRTGEPGPASFSVRRSADGLHILAEANIGADIHRGRVLPVRNRSLAQLLSREMEIVTNDNLYQKSLAVANRLIALTTSSRP